jgi:hypothetical protein
MTLGDNDDKELWTLLEFKTFFAASGAGLVRPCVICYSVTKRGRWAL